MSETILPGATIGILGSGQLGRMAALEARKMGYRVHTFSPDRDSPTGQVADCEVAAAYDDLDAVESFARDVDVVTFEFENVHSATADAAARHAPVRPDGTILHVTQNRLREKAWLRERGIPVAPFAAIHDADELARQLTVIGRPAVLKTAAWGYDGKGQQKLDSDTDPTTAWAAMDTDEAILESWIPYSLEVSTIAARGLDGTIAHFGVIENYHRNHILDLSIAPARVTGRVVDRAMEITEAILTGFGYVGTIGVEFFVTGNDDLLVNEIAPRPHNSGHLTFDACPTSQFGQQIRAICGLPLGDTSVLRPIAMVNLLGDLWSNNRTPNWSAALGIAPTVHLHLYGKAEPRPGRKMGHLTALAESTGQAEKQVIAARKALRPDLNQR